MSSRELRPGVESLNDGPRSTITAAQPLRPKTAGTGSGPYPGVGSTGEHPLQSALAALGTSPGSPVSATGPLSGPATGGGRARATGLHATSLTPSVQTLVRLGRYQIVSRIATGGMAEVYLAVHGELSGFRTPVVLKKVLPHLACNPHFIDMFLDEARIASLLDHPNVVRIYEVGRTGSEYFLAMELVQGKPLSAVVRRAHERHELVDHRLAAYVVAQAAAGLHHAHGPTDPLGNPLGLVHRDVSPQNILISFEGSVKVIDFGIARALGRISDTQTGGTKGKFGYMSPEQAKGEDVDLRTDIFALGVVLWEAVCGKRLFQRENDLATMRALIYDPIPKPSSVVAVSAELEAIILRALSRNPELRYPSAREMATALEKFVVSAGGVSTADLSNLIKTFFAPDVVAWQQTLRNAMNMPAAPAPEQTPAFTPPPPAPVLRRRRWPMIAGIVVVAGALAGAILMWTPNGAPVHPNGLAAPALPAAPAAQTPPPAATVEPLPAAVPAATADEAAGRADRDDRNAQNGDDQDDRKSRRRRHHHTHERSAPTPAAAPLSPERRPNPF